MWRGVLSQRESAQTVDSLVLVEEGAIWLGPLMDSRKSGDTQCRVNSLVGDIELQFCEPSMAEASRSWLISCGTHKRDGVLCSWGC